MSYGVIFFLIEKLKNSRFKYKYEWIYSFELRYSLCFIQTFDILSISAIFFFFFFFYVNSLQYQNEKLLLSNYLSVKILVSSLLDINCKLALVTSISINNKIESEFT